MLDAIDPVPSHVRDGWRNDRVRSRVKFRSISAAPAKQISEGKSQIAEVFFKDKQKNVSIGGVGNVFPTPAHVERFVEQVKARSRTAEGDDADTNRSGSHIDG